MAKSIQHGTTARVKGWPVGTGFIGATLINADLIFSAGAKTLPKSAAVIGKKSTESIKKLIDRKSPPASEPGQPPGRDTGDLQQGIRFNVMKSPSRSSSTGRFMSAPAGGGAYKLVVLADMPYAQTLEFGKKGKGRGQTMAPRPYFRPTFQSVGFQLMVQQEVARRFVIAERFAARKRGVGGLR
tara:strand:- start:517 stop:1068 length:552 start_codon:yes stop_codon:yes gene_type:complete